MVGAAAAAVLKSDPTGPRGLSFTQCSLKGQRKVTKKGICALWGEIRDRKDLEDKLPALRLVLRPVVYCPIPPETACVTSCVLGEVVGSLVTSLLSLFPCLTSLY